VTEPRQWSYSSLSTYEQCALKYKLNKIDGLDSPAGSAAARGTRIHEAIESYLKHETGGLPDVVQSSFGEELDRSREAYAVAEAEISLDTNWAPVLWDDGWVRAKLDMVIAEKSIIVDFKTGRYYPGHRDQASLYALLSMVSDLTEHAYVEFWYIDQNDVVTWEFNRRNLANLKEKWAFKAKQLQDETEWEATPNKFCKWCPFSASKGGQCVFGGE